MSTSTSKPSGVFSKAKSIFKKSKDGLSSLPEKVHMPRRSSVGAENSGDAVDVLDRLERVELSGREADEDSDEPGFGIRLKRSAGLVLPILKSDSRLNDLGMQLRELQLSMDKREHELRQKIQPSDAQGEKDRVRDLSAELRALQRSNAEAAEGPAHVALQIEELEDRIDAIKRHIYFPNTKYVFGCDGKYYAWDDMWVEHASGSIAVDMGSVAPAFKLGDRLSAGLQSRASIQLMGRPGGAGGGAETARNGVKLTVRLLHFGFKSENASLPTVFLEEVDLVLIVRIDCELLFTCGRGAVASKDGSAAAGIPSAGPAAASSRRGSTAPDGRRRDQPFDKIGPEPDSAIKTGDWTCESFTIDVVDFKGPFALGRSVMTTIAALITPKLKAWV